MQTYRHSFQCEKSKSEKESKKQSFYSVDTRTKKKKCSRFECPYCNVVKELQSNSKLNPVSKRIAINGASLLYEKLNPAFEKWSGIPLGEALSKVPEAKVEVKKSAGERKNVRRNIMRAAKDKVETQWKETALQRCGDADVEQLAYTETRCECLKKLRTTIELENGIHITDKMRFCKGDGPAVEFECGQQKGRTLLLLWLCNI
ncbi:hypothetical protein QZH41_010013 [Actinostola sp. cb2023]|nr:hypothetical protein QZH41_010013 [Actinostola sp. cb2023]